MEVWVPYSIKGLCSREARHRPSSARAPSDSLVCMGSLRWLLAGSHPAFALETHPGVERQLTKQQPLVSLAKHLPWKCKHSSLFLGTTRWNLACPQQAGPTVELYRCSVHSTLRSAFWQMKKEMPFSNQTKVPYVPVVVVP